MSDFTLDITLKYPTECTACPCCSIDNNDCTAYCTVLEKGLETFVDATGFYRWTHAKRPEWCPLKEKE